jgi:hypothetical protein
MFSPISRLLCLFFLFAMPFRAGAKRFFALQKVLDLLGPVQHFLFVVYHTF